MSSFLLKWASCPPAKRPVCVITMLLQASFLNQAEWTHTHPNAGQMLEGIQGVEELNLNKEKLLYWHLSIKVHFSAFSSIYASCFYKWMSSDQVFSMLVHLRLIFSTGKTRINELWTTSINAALKKGYSSQKCFKKLITTNLALTRFSPSTIEEQGTACDAE